MLVADLCCEANTSGIESSLELILDNELGRTTIVPHHILEVLGDASCALAPVNDPISQHVSIWTGAIEANRDTVSLPRVDLTQVSVDPFGVALRRVSIVLRASDRLHLNTLVVLSHLRQVDAVVLKGVL